MTGRQQIEQGIVRPAPTFGDVRSNVTVCSNLFPRSPEILEPERDVAFRCRVRGAIALRNIVPPGIIDSMSGKHGIVKLSEADRAAGFDGTLSYVVFALLPEQVQELHAFRCIDCGRSTVSVWFEKGQVQRRFVTCMCQRPGRGEESR